MSAYQCRCKYICPESTCFPRVSILSSYPVAADYGRTVCHKTFAYRPHQLEDTRFKPPKKTASQKTGEFSKPKKKETWFLNVVISHWSWSEARKKKKRVTAGAEISRLVCWWRKHISFTFPNQFPFFFLTEFRRCLIAYALLQENLNMRSKQHYCVYEKLTGFPNDFSSLSN